MDRFTDSTPIAADRDALRERLRTDGCVFFRGIIDRNKVLSLRNDILRAIESTGWLAPGSDALQAVPGDPPRQEARDGWWEGYTAIQSLESFHRFAYDESLLAMFRALVADDVFPHPRKIARVVYPARPEFTTSPHQDFTHIQGTVDFVTCWVPLGDCPADLGGLKILRGSHDPAAVRPLHRATGAGGVGTDVSDDDAAWATADYEAGDAVVFHSLCVHAGMPNTSGHIRLSTDNRYQSASDPVVPESLKPHLHPRIADWPELTKGWSSLEWIKAPDGVTTKSYQFPKESLENWHNELEPGESHIVQTG